MIEAKVIADSISETGKRITTMQLKFHRFILPEFNTHRVFSRNFSSSRAIPTAKLLEQIRSNPATPVFWGQNQPGMQSRFELVDGQLVAAKELWAESAELAVLVAEKMAAHGVHKQIVNRIIEPYMWVTGIVTSTEWDNFYALRNHEDAQPEIQSLARSMYAAQSQSIPQVLKLGEWHQPFITQADRDSVADGTYIVYSDDRLSGNMLLNAISAARCCRVSYLKHDGTAPDITDDIALFERLAGSVPIHASPLEHQATPDVTISAWAEPDRQGNFKGWAQFRRMWEIAEFANNAL